MKLKKEFLLLVIVIVGLSVYLIVRKTDRTHYALPILDSVKSSDISKVEITKGNGTIVLSKTEDDQWQILPEKYPADSSKIDGLLEAIGDLTLTALISESKNYSRYELDEKKRLVVKAWGGGKLKRELEIGKAAASFRHTFVKLPEDPRVYHARGNFRSRFDQSIEDFRDKTVLSFESKDIHDIHIIGQKTTWAFTRAQMPEEPKPEDTEAQQPPAARTVWRTPDGKEGKETEITRILNALSNLRCDAFINDEKKENFQHPTHTFQLKGLQDYSLSLFAKRNEGEKKYPAISSGSDSPFLLPEWQVNTLTKKLDTLVEEPSPNPTEKK